MDCNVTMWLVYFFDKSDIEKVPDFQFISTIGKGHGSSTVKKKINLNNGKELYKPECKIADASATVRMTVASKYRGWQIFDVNTKSTLVSFLSFL